MSTFCPRVLMPGRKNTFGRVQIKAAITASWIRDSEPFVYTRVPTHKERLSRSLSAIIITTSASRQCQQIRWCAVLSRRWMTNLRVRSRAQRSHHRHSCKKGRPGPPDNNARAHSFDTIFQRRWLPNTRKKDEKQHKLTSRTSFFYI